MNKTHMLSMTIIGAALFAMSASSALAADDRPVTAEERTRVVEALEKKGYKNVHDLEVDDDGRFEADATSPAGHPVDLDLDMKTLEILHEHRDQS